jgi:hypothetical protein
MKTYFVMSVFLFISSTAAAEHICKATCIDYSKVSYNQSGNKGPSYTILNRAVDVEATARTKRLAWRLLKKKCDPYLLLKSYKKSFELGVGNIVKDEKEAKKSNSCERVSAAHLAPNTRPGVQDSGALE